MSSKSFLVFLGRHHFRTITTTSKFKAKWLALEDMATAEKLTLDQITNLLPQIFSSEITGYEVRGWGNYMGEVG